ncbi:MAG: fatty acid desaturase [Bdellovibrionota bacterium]
MSIIDRMLEHPSYGYTRDQKLYVPTNAEIAKEFFSKINPMKRKNWLAFTGIMANVLLLGVLGLHFALYFNWMTIPILFVFGFFIMSYHLNFWVHRYCAHKAFQFSNDIARSICRNLTIKIVNEEVYTISHFVHHQYSDQPSDPYNAKAGWLYCFLAEVNHQGIRQDLTEEEYNHLLRLMKHTGVQANSYKQYLKWGSICHPFFTLSHYLLNWAFWFSVFFLIGGMSLATVFFGAAGMWGVLNKNFAYSAHGAGTDRKKPGIDFYQEDNSRNITWSGITSGEWHNNHHLYPTSARSGFQSYQVDVPWLLVYGLYKIGMISSYKNSKSQFDKMLIQTKKVSPEETKQTINSHSTSA